MEQRRARELSDRNHIEDFSKNRSRNRQAAGGRDSRQSGPKRHRYLDASSCYQAIRRHFHNQRRSRSSRDFIAKRRTRGGVENSAAPESSNVQRQSRSFRRRRAGRSLCVKNYFVRAGNGASSVGKRDVRM